MEVSNKVHKPLAIISGVVLLITVLANAVTSILNVKDYGGMYLTALLSIAQVAVPGILMAIALFRGKKDKTSGILMLITGAVVLLNGLLGMLDQLTVPYAVAVKLFMMLLTLITAACNAAIRGGIAVECLKPGKISGNKLKILLILLPAVTAILMTVSLAMQMTAYGFSGAQMLGTLIGSLLGNMFAMGILELAVLAYVIPVKQTPAKMYSQPVYQQPVYQQPAYQQPVYQQPAYQQPAYQQPAYQQSAYQQPAYQQPVRQDAVPVKMDAPFAPQDAVPVQLDIPFAPQDTVPVQLDIPFVPQDAAPVQMDAPFPPQNNP